MTIVQIGCNNGKDHILDFCQKNKDSIEAIHLIEPNPEALEDCKQTYSDFKQAKFHNLAVVTNDAGSVDLHIPRSRALNAHASTLKNHLTNHGHIDFDTINVPATSLAKFFDSNKITKCDRLYIDTEGLDCDIILGLDVKKYGIERIEFEVIHTDGVNTRGQKYSSCIDKLTALGFQSADAGEHNEAYQLC